MADLDLEAIRHALATARQSGFAEVELEAGASSFRAVLGPMAIRPKAAQAVVEEEPRTIPIAAHCVGYYKPSDSKLVVGHRVKRGEIVATINALGLGNDVESPVTGEVVEVLISPEEPVQFGQALALVREEEPA